MAFETRFERYNMKWIKGTSDLEVEIVMIQKGGQWVKKKDGQTAGNGLAWHWRRFQELVWPEKEWHKWSILQLECFLKYSYIAELGPASSGKSFNAATNLLTEYFCFPYETTIMLTTTQMERAEEKIWGAVKELFNKAIRRWPELPGRVISGKYRIVSDDSLVEREGTDFRNGVVVLPAKVGNVSIGLAPFIGAKRGRVRLFADEANMLPKTFIDSFANLNKNPNFKAWASGNPKDTTDALGFMAEPAADLGGWDSGIDQTPKTKTWRTKMPNGICIHLPGGDSPNNDFPDDAPKYKALINRAKMKADAQIWGVTDWHYKMFDEGILPKGMGSRRVLTRQMAITHHALDDPKWRDHRRTLIASLDAAYQGVGGDQCIFTVMAFGPEAPQDMAAAIITENLLTQNTPGFAGRTILALMYQKNIPIETNAKAGPAMMQEAEDQIVYFCKKECEGLTIPPANFFFDSGMRVGLVTAFARQWSPEVNAVDCGGLPSDERVSDHIDMQADKYFSKRITQLWWDVRFVVEAGQFRGMTEQPLTELCAREWKMVSGNRIEVESKPEFKAKLGYSPDHSDSLVIGVYGAKKRGFVIARPEILDLPKYDQAWKRKVQEQSQKAWHSKALTFAK